MSNNSTNDKKANIHSGHRTRLRTRARNGGLRTFEPHQVLEFILFFSIPQKDTNPLAHELLNRFKTIAGVFNADIEELMQVPGVSEYTATFLTSFPEIFRFYLFSSRNKLDSLKERDDVRSYLECYYMGYKKETPIVLLLNQDRELITEPIELSEGGADCSSISVRQIVTVALRHNTSHLILAHNHPAGDAMPSDADILFTQELDCALRLIDIKLIDHYVVGKDRFIGISELALPMPKD